MTDKKSLKRQKKEQIVTELSEKVNKAKSLIFTNYQGLTHQQIERIKRTAKKNEAEYITTKNTLLKKALKTKIDEKNANFFTKATATLFIYNDIAEPLKELTKIIKEINLPKIKFGIYNEKTITEEEINKIAALPPLAVLRAQTLGQMKSPITGLHRALNWNMQKLAITLNIIQQKKA